MAANTYAERAPRARSFVIRHTGKGTHYVWFQIVVPEVVVLKKFGYVLNCP